MSFFMKAINNIKKTASKATDKAKDLVQKKDKNVEEMQGIYDGLKLTATNRIMHAKKWTAWNQSLSNLGHTQNPDAAPKFEAIVEITNKIGEIEETLGKEEDRNAEDYRDIIERFHCLMGKNHKYIDAKHNYKAATQKVQEAKAKDAMEQSKPTYEQKKFKLLQAIEQAKDKKRQRLEELKDSLRDLIDHRGRYNKFKVRRLCEGWSRYGNALKTSIEEEISALQELQDAVNDLRDSEITSGGNAASVESAE